MVRYPSFLVDQRQYVDRLDCEATLIVKKSKQEEWARMWKKIDPRKRCFFRADTDDEKYRKRSEGQAEPVKVAFHSTVLIQLYSYERCGKYTARVPLFLSLDGGSFAAGPPEKNYVEILRRIMCCDVSCTFCAVCWPDIKEPMAPDCYASCTACFARTFQPRAR